MTKTQEKWGARKLRFREKYNFLCDTIINMAHLPLSAFEITIFQKRESDCSNRVSSSLQDKIVMARRVQTDNTDIVVGSHT